MPRPVLVERDRVTTLLGGATSYKALLLCAPVGSGKSTALRHYVERSGGAATYLRLSSLPSPERLDEALADPTTAGHVVIDDVDAAPAAVVDALVDRIAGSEDLRHFILAGRSRRRMRAHRLLAAGLASMMGASTLAFNHEELAELAARLGGQLDDETVVQLLHDTDGWATPLAWVVRDAMAGRHSMRGALERWIEERAHLLIDLLGTEHEGDREAFDTFKVRLRAGASKAQRELEEFEALGFPVIRTRRSFRPYRILSRMLRPESEPAHHAVAATPAMTLNAFASFSCEIGGRPLVFQRRRERNILTYVALAPEGRATRKELVDAFWPNADRAVATQSLRTAISHIRLAIANVVGADSVEHYFDSADDLRINFENVTFDVRRFIEHLRHGDVEVAHAAVEPAERHYAAAERLYRGRLLSAEAAEPCFAAAGEELERSYVEMLVARVQMYVASGDRKKARACACRVLEKTRDAAYRLRAMAYLDAKAYATA